MSAFKRCSSLCESLVLRFPGSRPSSTGSSSTFRVTVKEAFRFCVDCMTAVGTPAKHAQQLASVLVEADKRGHYSHGMNRLRMYVEDVRNGICDAAAVPTVLKENTCTAHVDGRNALGPTVGEFCMEKAIEKAELSGIGWVVTKADGAAYGDGAVFRVGRGWQQLVWDVPPRAARQTSTQAPLPNM